MPGGSRVSTVSVIHADTTDSSASASFDADSMSFNRDSSDISVASSRYACVASLCSRTMADSHGFPMELNLLRRTADDSSVYSISAVMWAANHLTMIELLSSFTDTWHDAGSTLSRMRPATYCMMSFVFD